MAPEMKRPKKAASSDQQGFDTGSEQENGLDNPAKSNAGETRTPRLVCG